VLLPLAGHTDVPRVDLADEVRLQVLESLNVLLRGAHDDHVLEGKVVADATALSVNVLALVSLTNLNIHASQTNYPTWLHERARRPAGES
jgi:hypothetical protein